MFLHYEGIGIAKRQTQGLRKLLANGGFSDTHRPNQHDNRVLRGH